MKDDSQASPVTGRLAVLLRLNAVVFGLVIVTLCLSACAPQRILPELGTVTGVVTVDGEPLADAQVKFYPNNGKTSYGMTDQAGRYELRYDKEVHGALLGYHTIVISKMVMVHGGAPEEVLPDRYSGDSQIRRLVAAGPNVFNFELQTDLPPEGDEPN